MGRANKINKLRGSLGGWRLEAARSNADIPLSARQRLTTSVGAGDCRPQVRFGLIDGRRTGTSKSRCHTGEGRYPSLVVRSNTDEISVWPNVTRVVVRRDGSGV